MNLFSFLEIPPIELSVPLTEVAIFLAFNTVFLLFRSVKLTFVTNLFFTMYLGFIFSKDKFFSYSEYSEYLVSLYIGLGVITVLCTLSASIRTEK